SRAEPATVCLSEARSLQGARRHRRRNQLRMPLNCYQKTSLLMRSLLVCFTLTVMTVTAPMMAAQKVELSIDASKTGAKIDRNIFGQFAEHLGHGIYEGIWVDSDSTIP